jgi:hypothetical protein
LAAKHRETDPSQSQRHSCTERHHQEDTEPRTPSRHSCKEHDHRRWAREQTTSNPKGHQHAATWLGLRYRIHGDL